MSRWNSISYLSSFHVAIDSFPLKKINHFCDCHTDLFELGKFEARNVIITLAQICIHLELIFASFFILHFHILQLLNPIFVWKDVTSSVYFTSALQLFHTKQHLLLLPTQLSQDHILCLIRLPLNSNVTCMTNRHIRVCHLLHFILHQHLCCPVENILVDAIHDVHFEVARNRKKN